MKKSRIVFIKTLIVLCYAAVKNEFVKIIFILSQIMNACIFCNVCEIVLFFVSVNCSFCLKSYEIVSRFHRIIQRLEFIERFNVNRRKTVAFFVNNADRFVLISLIKLEIASDR